MHKRTAKIPWSLAIGGIVRFAASSLTAFAVDYTLYGVLVALTNGLGGYSLLLSNVCARAASATLNFGINKRLVFQSRESALTAGAKYFALALCILAGNTALLYLLVHALSLNKYIAKLVAELIFFLASWHVQRVYVFKERASDFLQKPKG